MRLATCFLIVLAASACDRSSGDTPRQQPEGVDQSQLYSSAGEVQLTDGGSLEFSITSERYKQWYAAQQAIDKRIARQFGTLLQPASPSERSIDRAVRYLENEPAARDAIRRAGMSVREFVVTTVALEQEMRVASTSRSVDTMPLPMPYPYPLDSAPPTVYPTPYPAPTPYPTPTYPPGYQPYPATPPAYPVTPGYPLPERRIDTTRMDTILPGRDTLQPRRDTLPRDREILSRPRVFMPAGPDSAPRRDSVVPRRDSLPPRDSVAPRRDTLVPRPPRDTL